MTHRPSALVLHGDAVALGLVATVTALAPAPIWAVPPLASAALGAAIWAHRAAESIGATEWKSDCHSCSAGHTFSGPATGPCPLCDRPTAGWSDVPR